MSSKRYFLIMLLSVLPFMQATAEEVVHIGVLIFRPLEQELQKWDPLADALKQEIPEYNFKLEPLTYDALEEAVATRQIDFILTNPSHYIQIARAFGLGAPIATVIENEGGKPTMAFGGVIIARADRKDIHNIPDLVDKKIAATNTKSLGSYQAQAYELYQKGVSIRSLMRHKNYEQVVESVQRGYADAGFVRTGVLEQMASTGRISLQDFKIINLQNLPDYPFAVSTRLYPEWPFAPLPHTEPNLTRKVAAVLLKTERKSTFDQSISIHGFNIPADYSPVETMLKDLRLPPFDSSPEFTLLDIWHRYKIWILAVIFSSVLAVTLSFWLISINRRLSQARQSAEQVSSLLKDEHQQLEAVLLAVPDLLFELDEQGVFINIWNKDEASVTIERQKLLGSHVSEFMPDSASKVLMECIHEANTQGRSLGHQIKLKVNEQLRWFELSVALKLADAESRSYIFLSRDITERKNTDEGLRLAALVYQNTNEAMIVMDAQHKIMSLNPAFTKMTGYSAEEVMGKEPHMLYSQRHESDFYADMWQSMEREGEWKGEVWNQRKSGEEYPVLLTMNNVYTDEGELQMRVALFSDLSYIKESEALIWQQANYDALTNLPNRRLFLDRLEQELKKAHRDKDMLALLFLDLDHFKEVNDTLGHHIGDILLKEAASRIQACVREADTVARLGGDEFTLILSELSDFAHIERVAQNILNELNHPFVFDQKKSYISASIGITIYPEDGQSVETLLKNADQAMYAAKQSGRNRYRYFTRSMQEAAQERVQLSQDMREALPANQFHIVYQPIIDLNTGKINKAEALLRWQHPERGLINPTRFIPIAEDIGTIHEIGDWVFHEAANQTKRWRGLIDPTFQVSINASPVQFHDKKRLDSRWIQYLQKHGLAEDSIVVEITEGLLLHSHTSVQDKLLRFRDAGIQVAIDDFGTGYSSLAYLNKFDIDYLKIDQSFVRNIATHPHDLTLTEAIIVMAHKLGLKVIAEGVETEEQFKLLKNVGCDYAQGFLFSDPLPAEQLENLLLQILAESKAII